MWPALDWLQTQWFELTAVLPQNERAEQVFWDLTTRYGEDGRFYHTLNHIQTMLQMADDYRHLVEDWMAVCLAIWFHDAVYKPGALDNELLSAKLAVKYCAALGLSPHTIQKIEDLILATRLDAVISSDVDTFLVMDADLAVLGAEPAAYDAYAQGVRQEFSFVNDADFKRGRTAVLRRFLQKERLYHLEPCFERFEQAARTNIQRELQILNP